jgi:hypothetical protein
MNGGSATTTRPARQLSGSSQRPQTSLGQTTPANLPRANQNPPLILRGSESAVRESVPSSSLVITGTKGASGRSANGTATRAAGAVREFPTTSATHTPAPRPDVPTAAPATSGQNSAARPVANQNSTAHPAANQNWQRNPAWLATQTGEKSPRLNPPTTAYRPETPRREAPIRTAPVEVPRSTPSSTYVPQRSYPPPALPAQSRSPVMESRPAPSAPSAPPAHSAPAQTAPSSHSQSNSGRNGR